MGANRAGEVAELVALARPAVGLITNAGAEHLEGFGSLEGVARAEGEMVAGLAADGVAVINADDEFAPLWRGMTRARVVDFGFAAGAAVRATDVRLEATAQGFATRFTLHSTSWLGAGGAGAGRTPQRQQRAGGGGRGAGGGRHAAAGRRGARARCRRSRAACSSSRSPAAPG